MSKVTIQAHVYQRESVGDQPMYALFGFEDNSGIFGAYVGPAILEYEIPPEFNPVAAEIAQIEAAKKLALDGYNKSVEKLNERLHKLQAITA